MSKEKNSATNPALELAKEVESGDQKIITLPNGAAVQVLPVSATLLDEVSSRVIDPEPPMFMNEEKGREEPNPYDPSYIKQLERNERRRSVAAMDVMAMFGLEIVSGMPEDDGWINRLQMMERLGHISLESYDLTSDLDKEFLYKRFIILSAPLLGKIGAASGLTEEEVAKAEATFPGN